MEHLQFPVGRFQRPSTFTEADLQAWIADIEALPTRLREALATCSAEKLDQPYRPGGWTRRQVVHHLADSHINAHSRVRFAVAEGTPVIRPYNEGIWAEFEDAKHAPVELSLAILDGIHARWVIFFKSLPLEAFHRGYFHPENQRVQPLFEVCALYAWHSRHHVAHILL